jgi:electron transfer flavoprotein beta subunit
MKFLICISNVPDTTTKITFHENLTQFNSAGVQYILNPYDELSIARALELAEGGKATLTVIHVGELSSEPTIRKALALGADEAVRINASPKDAHFVAHQIAHYAKSETYDIIFFGRESIDYNGAQVCARVGEILGMASVSIVKKLDITGNKAILEREIEGGKEILEVNMPFVLSSTEGIAEPKIPNMRGIMSARTKPLTVLDPIEVEELEAVLHFESPKARGAVHLVKSDEVLTLAELLHNEAKVI